MSCNEVSDTEVKKFLEDNYPKFSKNLKMGRILYQKNKVEEAVENGKEVSGMIAFYEEMKKCDLCNCHFFNSSDLSRHTANHRKDNVIMKKSRRGRKIGK